MRLALCLFVLFGIVAFCAVVGLAQEPESTTRYERLVALSKLPQRQKKAEMWKMPKAEREGLIQEMKTKVHPSVPESSLRNRLLFLGDQQAAKELVAEMAADPIHTEHGLSRSGNPYVIPYLAEHFFIEEPYSVAKGDAMWRPLSFTASSIAIGVLADSAAFNGEVISWARRILENHPTALRTEMRRWWKENETYFQNEDFLAVKPGLAILEKTPLGNSESARPTTVAAITPEPVQTTSEPAHAQESKIMLLISGGLLVALLVGIVVTVRGRHR